MRPDISGRSLLRTTVREIFANLSVGERNMMMLNMVDEFGASLDVSSPTPIPFGTACSGSEIYLSALRHIEDELRGLGSGRENWAITSLPIVIACCHCLLPLPKLGHHINGSREEWPGLARPSPAPSGPARSL